RPRLVVPGSESSSPRPRGEGRVGGLGQLRSRYQSRQLVREILRTTPLPTLPPVGGRTWLHQAQALPPWGGTWLHQAQALPPVGGRTWLHQAQVAADDYAEDLGGAAADLEVLGVT